MKNGLLLLFIVVTLASCSSRDNLSVENEPNQQQQQQELIAQNLETTEEPEFVIEAEYDPALAEKAAENKRNKIEETSPIALTSDDDDLTEDKNDLPQNVTTHTIRAYDYKEDDFLSDSENRTKGKSPKATFNHEGNTKALYFVVAGAYKDEKEAQKKSEEIIKLGYKVELITFDKNFKTVCVAKLENRSQADLLAKALQIEKIDAYVVKRRK
ncbi:MAG: SPOR domain-containing protein [Saprospiraceae bacterium]